MVKKIAVGTAHSMPPDLLKKITSNKVALMVWEDITPLARNEWVCWVISPKQIETRKNHIKRAVKELIEGKRRPCCWAGCTHR